MRTPFKTLLAAFVAVSMVAFAGCGKDGSNSSTYNGGISSGNGNGIVNPIPHPTPGPSPNPQPTINWVDLGLPSGLLWAECNVGATVPEEYGDYFAWGETTTKSTYSWSTYRYCTTDGEGNLSTLTKYNTSSTYGTTDTLTTLLPGDDAATARLGGGARTPTYDEWSELLNNTTAEWTTLNGVNGRRFTSTTNGNSIFLPAAGWRSGSELDYAGGVGYYWSSSLDSGSPSYARRFGFGSGAQDMYYGSDRYNGLGVRAVRANQN